ncbi:MAG: hypothetical protein MJB14_16065, partial [Spirochaetes bacterium]|nr:hypothetical protein [Spirochaetota bacterium]
ENISICLYVQSHINTDFSIHIEHQSGPVEKMGSELGLNIASNLKVFGLVNHNVWKEAIS